MAKHHMYDESPAIKHTEEGHTKVVKTPKKDDGDGPVEKGVKEEGFKESGMPEHVRHAHERQNMHAKHEHEHAMHDHHGGDKKEMHERHEKEFKEMHTRHEKEMGHDGGEESGKGGSEGKRSEPIQKAEKGTKG